MSAGLSVEIKGQREILLHIQRFEAFDQHELLESIGALLESSARERLAETKTGPDGKPWPAWSERYAKTRHGGHSLLMNEGHLQDSIQYTLTGDTIEIGSNLVYAGTHQHGSKKRNIPPRPFLGISDADRDAIDDLITDFSSDLTGP